MLSVSATEFIKGFGRHNLLAQREPIAITNHGNITGYYISAFEYDKLQNIKTGQRASYTIETLPEELYQEIINSSVSPEFSYLNNLSDDLPSSNNT